MADGKKENTDKNQTNNTKVPWRGEEKSWNFLMVSGMRKRGNQEKQEAFAS
jgi:hypothetical protein